MLNATGKEETIGFGGFDFKYVLKDRAYDTNHLIVVFSGYGGNSDFNYDFLGALKSSRAYVLWIKDDFFNNERATYYIDPITNDNKDLEKAIISFINNTLIYLGIERENCSLMGCSKGGASALYYGIKYDFHNILLSVPTLLIGSSIMGLIPKGHKRKNAKLMLGDKLSKGNIDKLDSIILKEIENDKNYNRNIYLISSKEDPKFNGQIQPFLSYFLKYHNFNFIESSSVLVRTHSEVTIYNAPLIVSILGCLTFNLPPVFNRSIIYGDNKDKPRVITKSPVLKVNKLSFDQKGFFYPEGVFFLRGLPCAEYSDVDYRLKLESEKNVYEFTLAKGNNKNVTKEYYENSFINYDKAIFCTAGHKGINLSEVEPDLYLISVKITMSSGETNEQILFMDSLINNRFSDNKTKQEIYNDQGKSFYIKSKI